MKRVLSKAGMHAICALLAVSGAFAQSAKKVIDRADFEAKEEFIVEKLEKIDNKDGTYSFALPEGFDPEVRLRGRILTWRYAGQARYAHKPEPVSGPRVWEVPEPKKESPEDLVRAMKRIDYLGRIWKVEEIDHEAWKKVIEEANKSSEESEGEPGAKEREHEPDWEPGTKVEWWPQSWTHSNCDGRPNPRRETHLWEGESRSRVTGTFNNQEASVVRVTNTMSTGQESTCTGTILGQRQILTAAHCVSDNSNNPVPTGQVRVCRDDIGLRCLGARDIDFSPSYGGGSGSGGGSDFSDDWAIIKLMSTWEAASYSRAEEMDMSRAGDSVLDALYSVYNLGYPGFAPDCTDRRNGFRLFGNREWERIAATLGSRIRFKIDNTGGHSGGPYYYCPEGNDSLCRDGENPYVYAVSAGWSGGNNRAVGSRVSRFRSAALAFMLD